METKLVSQLQLSDYPADTALGHLLAFVRESPDEVAGLTVHQLAARAQVSASTVERFCRAMGCQGYRDFQQSLAYGLALQRQTQTPANDDLEPTDTTASMVSKVIARDIHALELVARNINPKDIEKTVALMRQARSICLFGIGASYLVVKDLNQKLTRVAKLTNIDADWQQQLMYARNMTKQDLAIAVSYTGLTKETVECAKTAQKRGSKVISITRTDGRSRLAKCSDILLGVPDTESYLRSGAMSSRIASLGVVDVLYTAYVSGDSEESFRLYAGNFIGKDEE